MGKNTSTEGEMVESHLVITIKYFFIERLPKQMGFHEDVKLKWL